MDKPNSESTGFLGTYFDRGAVIVMAQVARVSSWIFVAVYGVFALNSVWQLTTQFSQGAFWEKGSTVVNIIGIVSGYFTQPLMGLLYFVVLQAIAHLLLILLDVEDNTRRNARK